MALFFVDDKPIQPNNDISPEATKSKGDNSWLAPVMMFYAKVTSWIIAPVGIAILLVRMTGKDGLFFPAIIIGFLVTIYGIYREINAYKKTLNKDGNRK